MIPRKMLVVPIAVALLLAGCGSNDGPEMALDAAEDVGAEDSGGDDSGNVGVDGPDGLVMQETRQEEVAAQCSCGDHVCGTDNCGNSCGACLPTQTCSAIGQCVDPPVQCSVSGFSPVEQTAEGEAKDNGGFFIHYQGISSTNLPLNGVVIEVDGGPPLGGPVSSGTYDIKCKNMGTCGLRVYLIEGWNGSGYTRFYAPTQGTITIQSMNPAGGTFSGSLNGVVVKEAVIDQATQAVSFVPGGASWCLDGYQFAAEVAFKQSYCVEKGSGVMLGDNIKNFKLQNCNGETVGLHTLCGKGKAIWVVATAGW